MSSFHNTFAQRRGRPHSVSIIFYIECTAIVTSITIIRSSQQSFDFSFLFIGIELNFLVDVQCKYFLG